MLESTITPQRGGGGLCPQCAPSAKSWWKYRAPIFRFFLTQDTARANGVFQGPGGVVVYASPPRGHLMWPLVLWSCSVDLAFHGNAASDEWRCGALGALGPWFPWVEGMGSGNTCARRTLAVCPHGAQKGADAPLSFRCPVFAPNSLGLRPLSRGWASPLRVLFGPPGASSTGPPLDRGRLCEQCPRNVHAVQSLSSQESADAANFGPLSGKGGRRTVHEGALC